MTIRTSPLWACALTMLGNAALSQDIKGSRDHPMLSRFPGSVIVRYEENPFNETYLATKKATVPQFTDQNSQRVEGKWTDIVYNVAPDRSTLEIYNSYKQALTGAGFKVLFECVGSGCGYSSPFKSNRFSANVSGNDIRYLSGKLTRSAGDVYVSLLTFLGENKVRTGLTVVEARPMESGLITYNAQAMSEAIRNTGRIALYGILFNTDKTEPTPESAPTLTEIAQLLKNEPTLKLLVVGHTDRVGNYDYNMDLSRRRAEAVVAKLVSEHQINAGRLKAVGIGYASPVATNRTDEGKAKNRRVELVEQ